METVNTKSGHQVAIVETLNGNVQVSASADGESISVLVQRESGKCGCGTKLSPEQAGRLAGKLAQAALKLRRAG